MTFKKKNPFCALIFHIKSETEPYKWFLFHNKNPSHLKGIPLECHCKRSGQKILTLLLKSCPQGFWPMRVRYLPLSVQVIMLLRLDWNKAMLFAVNTLPKLGHGIQKVAPLQDQTQNSPHKWVTLHGCITRNMFTAMVQTCSGHFLLPYCAPILEPMSQPAWDWLVSFLTSTSPGWWLG